MYMKCFIDMRTHQCGSILIKQTDGQIDTMNNKKLKKIYVHILLHLYAKAFL